jgi:hypothetical protein
LCNALACADFAENLKRLAVKSHPIQLEFKRLPSPSLQPMPDFTVRGIDISMAERIKELARAKNWSINDVVLDLLQKALEMNGSASSADAARVDHQDVALLSGTWANDEAAAFRAALEAFEQLPPDTPLTSR